MSSDSPSRAIRDKKMLHLPDWSLIDLPEYEVKSLAQGLAAAEPRRMFCSCRHLRGSWLHLRDCCTPKRPPACPAWGWGRIGPRAPFDPNRQCLALEPTAEVAT